MSLKNMVFQYLLIIKTPFTSSIKLCLPFLLINLIILHKKGMFNPSLFVYNYSFGLEQRIWICQPFFNAMTECNND